MNTYEMQVGRITAIVEAADEVIKRAKKHGNRGTVTMAKETAFDNIKGIIEDPGYCPWQE